MNQLNDPKSTLWSSVKHCKSWKVYQEALEECGLDGRLATARISAAAYLGDVQAAARVLDDMDSARVNVATGFSWRVWKVWIDMGFCRCICIWGKENLDPVWRNPPEDVLYHPDELDALSLLP